MAVFYLGGFMKCINCKAENKDTYIKCKKCGQLLAKQKGKEILIEEIAPYNWVPSATMIVLLIIAILIIKIYLKY